MSDKSEKTPDEKPAESPMATPTPTDATERIEAKAAAVFADIALDVSTMMASLMAKWQRHEPMIANCLCDSLAGIIAIAAKDPQAALVAMGQRLRTAPWEAMKAQHYGYSKLGVQAPGGPNPTTLGPSGAARVIQMGDPRKR